MRVVVVGVGSRGSAPPRDCSTRTSTWSCSRRRTAPAVMPDPRGGQGFASRPARRLPRSRARAARADRAARHHLACDHGARRGERIASSSCRGRMRRVPDSPVALLTTDALSIAGRLRVLAEPWARSAPAGVEETVHDFARRRIGGEAADALVDPAIAGISAGDSRALSVAASFPAMVEMERKHGSLIRADGEAEASAHRTRELRRRHGHAGRRRCARARSGVSPLARRCARSSARRPRVAGRARARREPRRRPRRARDAWRIAPPPLVRGRSTPSSRARWGDPVRRRGGGGAGLSRRRDLAASGYGVLVDREAARDTLGVVWESSVFEGRAPSGLGARPRDAGRRAAPRRRRSIPRPSWSSARAATSSTSWVSAQYRSGAGCGAGRARSRSTRSGTASGSPRSAPGPRSIPGSSWPERRMMGSRSRAERDRVTTPPIACSERRGASPRRRRLCPRANPRHGRHRREPAAQRARIV